MAGGWSKDGAVQEQIDSSVEDAVAHVRHQLSMDESLLYCEECDVKIPEARRSAMSGITLCINCQSKLEKNRTRHNHYNRRGSKDSQLR
ncbi:DksA/TraR family C4-type zinc finger protein [Colwellia sp. MB3u-70]|uniref:DksA/TraR family C4-type zinc finger protein n=1 Tax=unclassified Colwellia TaxID=196834 RepID=UPI0015F45138|nr:MULTISPECIES: DksA/TraR family C4-type zinc finger protein [unclassified Colwellia]MBA6292357.1 DksA/TraR family C4-type zinc finger protein [Colwellia sp. MB3u-8]MBA6307192.1 DksA/TraR family C4-type zinc finger protein [Colwellia sp. MB3u-70]